MSEGEFKRRLSELIETIDWTHEPEPQKYYRKPNADDFNRWIDEAAKDLRKALKEGRIEDELRRWFGAET